MFDHDDVPSNPREGAVSLEVLVQRRISRRGLLGGAAGMLTLAPVLSACATSPDRGSSSVFDFPEIERGGGITHVVPDGYRAEVLLRWGDPLFGDAPEFAPTAQSSEAQRRQFGYNCDYIAFFALPGARRRRALICVNHEYTIGSLMFDDYANVTEASCAVERAAHGVSIVEIELVDDVWRVVRDSGFNRRISADTPMALTGPAAGHARLATIDDPTGRAVVGTFNNCAGGKTPWGAYLAAEENINAYFLGALPDGHQEAGNHRRFGLPIPAEMAFQWGRYDPRFDLARSPNEPNRFGWMVEIDPRDPNAVPKKRTALGRFKHEGAESVIAPDGRVVLYMGDDQRFEYVYKFVTRGRFSASDPDRNRDLLDEGTLYVARFQENGELEWLPLVYGQGPLIPANGFQSQADVLIETRRAADLLGATPMDRPEDVQPNARTGRVYIMLTNNTARSATQTNAANPRASNAAGHIIEIIEPDGDFSATRSRWEVLVLCGDPSQSEGGARWNVATSPHGWFAAPDNCTIDPRGRLWVATDGNEATGANDGLWAMVTEGAMRGAGRAFFRAPIGAEVCGPCFSDDGRTLFLSVQHPGEGSTIQAPSTRWPDFDDATPPRPAVLAIRRVDGGLIGG